jgi:hypothetical protein
MAQEIEVGVRLAYKVNTGNFENCDVEVSLKTIVEGGKPEAVAKYNQLYATAEELLEQKVQEIRS